MGEPGDYYDQNKIDKSLKKIARYLILTLSMIMWILMKIPQILISPSKKISKLEIAAGSFNADVGVGVNFGVEDTNVFGSGNRTKSNFSINLKI